MLTSTINSYAYQQYADDDDIQAFVSAYNQATQAYVTWFATVGLPYYPGLSGDLLNWVAEGLYGQTRTTLASPATPALGMLNTEELDTATLNSYVPSTQTYYTLSDDVFQRILTWNFYKGDGKRFCMRWLKRRIMRFLAGANGIDAQPWNPGFVVGAENTSAIGVSISGGVLTVGINQALLSNLLQIDPGVMTLFQIAFQSGVLDLPIQYTYVVNIQTTLAVTVAPPTESAVGSTASITTGSAIVTANGGSGAYTYVWTWQTGGVGIAINSPSAATTSFTASGLTSGSGVSGIAKCTVTDTSNGHVATATVSVSIERSTLPTAVVAPLLLTATGASSSVSTSSATVTVNGGVGPYTFAWGWQTGGVGIVIASPSSATTLFTGTGLTASQTESGTAICTVTDHFGQQTTVTLPVSVTRSSLVSASASPVSLSVTNATASETTGACAVTASGGQAPYTYQWSWPSGGANITINSPTSASTTFTGSGLIPGGVDSGTAQCTVKDAYGQIATATCAVTITRVTSVAAIVSPTSETASGISASQTTGTSTVTASGGSGSYTFAWTWSSGGTGIVIGSPSAASTNFSASGMTAGNTYSGVAKCTIKDGYGQTNSVTVSVSITRIVSTFTFSGQAATTSAIPVSATQMVIEVWGPGAPGGAGFGSSCNGAGGGGGGAGGYTRKTLSLTSANWNKTIAIGSTLSTVTSVVVSSGTFAIPTLTVNEGTAGSAATGSSRPGAGGAGGTSSGGDVNTTGTAGHAGASGGIAGAGGAGVAGVHGGPYGAGGHGGAFSGAPVQAGAVPGVVVYYA